VIVAWLLLTANASGARPLVSFRDEAPIVGSVGVATGFDNAVLPVTLTGAIGLPVGARRLVGWAAVTAPMLAPDLHDHRLEVGAALPLVGGRWDVPLAVGLREVSTRNDAFRATAVGSMVGAYPGRYGPRSTLAVDLELWTAWAMHLKTTTFVETYGGVAPWRGWTARTAQSGRVGAAAAACVGRVEVGARAGYETRGRLNLVIPPVYATAHLGYRIGREATCERRTDRRPSPPRR
jgi:hypothetical protein